MTIAMNVPTSVQIIEADKKAIANRSAGKNVNGWNITNQGSGFWCVVKNGAGKSFKTCKSATAFAEAN